MSDETKAGAYCVGPHVVCRDLDGPEPFCHICGQSSDKPAPFIAAEPTCRGSHDPHLSGRCWVCGGWRWEAPKKEKARGN